MEINMLIPNSVYRFNIDGIEYTASAFFSMNLFEIFIDAIEQGKTCKEAVAQMLFEALEGCSDNRPSFEELLSHDDVLQGYISALLAEDEELKAEYEKVPQNESVYSRFEISMRNYYRETVGKIASITKKAFMQPAQRKHEALPEFNKAIRLHTAQFSPQVLHTTNLMNIFANALKPLLMFESINNTISELTRTYSSVITNILPTIRIPSISEERKQELCEIYEQWGKYGWSVLQNAPIRVFNTKPVNAKEADKIATSYLRTDDISQLFKQFRENKSVKQSDLSEAIYLFEHKMYKSCSMIIFGMLDSKLIRAQGRKNRDVGKRAINKLTKRLLTETNIEETFFYLLHYTNTMACLNQIYKNYEDFDNEPKLINRNFVMHGMITRRVTRKDCLQLFLLYWNLLELMEFDK